MFAYWKRGSALLKAAQDLCARQQRAIEQLETENLKLIGQVFQLSNPSKHEVTTMTHEDELRAINLTDAAGRASNSGLADLALKLSQQAEKLLGDAKGQSFQDYGADRGLNMERLLPSGCTTNGEHQHFASKHTQELFDYWLAARGQKVWTPPK